MVIFQIMLISYLYQVCAGTRMRKLTIIYLLFISVYWINPVELTIKYRDGSSEIRSYPDNTEKINFTYGAGRNITEIVGLEYFPRLKELWLGMTAFIRDYNFLEKLNTLEVLVFQDIQFSDINFLYGINSLKRLIFQSCRLGDNIIDASKLPYLEYFECTNSQLVKFPIEIKERRKIDTINIAYNNIEDITIPNYMDILIIAVGNPLLVTDTKKIITGPRGTDIYNILPENYRQYLR